MFVAAQKRKGGELPEKCGLRRRAPGTSRGAFVAVCNLSRFAAQ
jgi:hypothetical protein